MRRDYMDDWDRYYNKPHIDNVIVGFSGIDPAPKAISTEEIESVVEDLITADTASDLDVYSMMNYVLNS